MRLALGEVGRLARGRGLALLLDEAHTVFDTPRKAQYPLGALLSAFVAAQDDDDEPLPVMLVLCGLPPLIGNIHRARSNAERLFKAEHIGNLSIARGSDGLSDAALALVQPARDSGEIEFRDDAAEAIARDVDGYPFFVQWFGEALWDAADVAAEKAIDTELYTTHRTLVQGRARRRVLRAPIPRRTPRRPGNPAGSRESRGRALREERDRRRDETDPPGQSRKVSVA